jgi:hypothetical protein
MTGAIRHLLPHPADPMERAEWTSELVYGTLTVLIAIAGIDVAGGASAAGTGAIVLVGAAATWFAHAFSAVLGRRAHLGAHASAGVGHALLKAWPILLAAVPAVIAFGGASLGWWSASSAMTFSNVAGIVVLGGAGWIAARTADSSLAGRIGTTIVTASIGAVIVLVEMLVH